MNLNMFLQMVKKDLVTQGIVGDQNFKGLNFAPHIHVDT